MTTVHRILLTVIDGEDYPDDSVIHAITSSTDGIRILEHDTVMTDWDDDHYLNRSRLTVPEFERWFSRAKVTAPTVQTVISLIRCAPDDLDEKKWLVSSVLPFLFANEVQAALDEIEEESQPGYTRPLLITLVNRLLLQCWRNNRGDQSVGSSDG